MSLDSLGHSKYFSTLDVTSGYWQIELKKEAKEKTAFTTRNGLYQWEVLPFGLTSAPSTFERLMEMALKGVTLENRPDISRRYYRVRPRYKYTLDSIGSVRAAPDANLKLKPKKCKLFARRLSIWVMWLAIRTWRWMRTKSWPTPRREMPKSWSLRVLSGIHLKVFRDL